MASTICSLIGEVMITSSDGDYLGEVTSRSPPSPRGYIARKANVVKRCPKVKQNMRINMVLTIFDNIVWFKRNIKK